MTLGYYTVVYRVDGDNAAHSAWWESIRPLFMTDNEAVSISVISKADEVARLDCITQIIEGRLPYSEKVEAVSAMLIHLDPQEWLREHEEVIAP